MSIVRKVKCPHCGTKTAKLDPVTRIAKCHICGKEFAESSQQIFGSYNIEQGIDEKGRRYTDFTIFPEQLEITERGFKKIVRIYEED